MFRRWSRPLFQWAGVPPRLKHEVGQIMERYRVNAETAEKLHAALLADEIQSGQFTTAELSERFGIDEGLMRGIKLDFQTDDHEQDSNREKLIPRKVSPDLYVGEQQCVPPFKIIGMRNPKHLSFVAWGVVSSPFRRRTAATRFYLTFQDGEGKVVGPVCYHGDIRMYALKVEIGPRIGLTFLSKLPETEFDYIPTEFRIKSGLDVACAALWCGGIFTQFHLSTDDDPKGFLMRHLGTGNALGLGNPYAAKFTRLASPADPKWPLQESVLVSSAVTVYVCGWVYFWWLQLDD